MTRQLTSIALAPGIVVALLSIGIPGAQAKQRCSAAIPSKLHAHWSYRIIDGRKCWYEGKPMLSKSLLEWREEASAQLAAREKPTGIVGEKPGSPPDSQAWTAKEPDTFEARWRARVD
jgi:hypothetical protein